ncbi:MAG: 2-oxoglutarate dehydrogenase subunit E1, partial [Bdellovibrionales bacterium]
FKGRDDVALVRVEQLYPFPRVPLTPYLNGLPKLNRVVWAQEEPKNMGAYGYILPHLNQLLSDLGKKKLQVEYVGRTERASPAVGSPYRHQKEQTEVLEKVFNG